MSTVLQRPELVGLLLYGLVLVAGAFVVGRRAPGAWVTTRTLLANEQIQEADVRWQLGAGDRTSLRYSDRPVGKHLSGTRRRGWVLDADDVRPLPDLSLVGGDVVLLTYTPEAQPELLRPGILRPRADVQACVGVDSIAGSPCFGTVVVGVHRASSPADSSWIVLGVEPGDVGSLARFMSSDDPFLVVER